MHQTHYKKNHASDPESLFKGASDPESLFKGASDPVLESPDPLTAFKALSGMLTEESEKEATPDGVGMASLSSSW